MPPTAVYCRSKALATSAIAFDEFPPLTFSQQLFTPRRFIKLSHANTKSDGAMKLRYWAVGLLAALSIAAVVSARKISKQSGAADNHRRAVQALNRLTFGPRPGDAEAVAAMGVDKWIELQLHPEKIDDGAMQVRLAQYRTLRMSTREMALEFPSNQLLKTVVEGKVAMPNDPYRRAIYAAGIARLQFQEAEKKSTDATTSAAQNNMAAVKPVSVNQPSATNPVAAQRQQDRRDAHELVDNLSSLESDARMQRILNLSPGEQAALLKGLPGPRKQALLAGLSPLQRETVLALDNPQGLVNYEAQSGKLLRAIYSDRQLEEVLTDFWFNHFNVFIGKGADRYMVTGYERDVIRPHVLGKFKDLLIATAQSPAMLFYLDNWQSEGPNSEAATGHPLQARAQAPQRRWGNGPFGPRPVAYPNPGQPPQSPKTGTNQGQLKRRNGLNENYARELMELHTLGVNGGYTQQDVTEVARVFTGWTLQDPREGGGFVFKPKLHEPGKKTVLGHPIKENGEKEGLQVLEILAHHPSTAHFISLKLAQRFVSDDPPPALVNQMAKTFLKTDGDLREVMRTLFRSQEFWAPEAYRAKVKTPFEYIVSAIRATQTDVIETQPLLNTLNSMGMGLYGMQPPTGYSTKADTWVNSSALLDRMNFAMALVNNKVAGAHFDAAQILPAPPASDATAQSFDPYADQVRLEQTLLAGDISPKTHQTIEQALTNMGSSASQTANRQPSSSPAVALLLGSPEFQRR